MAVSLFRLLGVVFSVVSVGVEFVLNGDAGFVGNANGIGIGIGIRLLNFCNALLVVEDVVKDVVKVLVKDLVSKAAMLEAMFVGADESRMTQSSRRVPSLGASP